MKRQDRIKIVINLIIVFGFLTIVYLIGNQRIKKDKAKTEKTYIRL